MPALENFTTHAYESSRGTIELAVKTSASSINAAEKKPGLIWLGGYRSDMDGTKAEAMVAWAEEWNTASLRFDYSGHGRSGGDFTDGCISDWVAESLEVVRNHSEGPQVLLGSSMGGWISLRLVQELQKLGEGDRIAGLVLIAPAPDFTKELMFPSMSAEQQSELMEKGFILEPSEYSDEPNIITRKLIEDGADNLVLDAKINVKAPVRIIQGMNDPDVPYEHAMRLIEALPEDDVVATLVKDGDHRLSRDQDIALIKRVTGALL